MNLATGAPDLSITGQVPLAFHGDCWEAVRLSTVEPGVVASYVTTGTRDGLTLEDQANTVTCAVCGDTWLLSGPGLTLERLTATRRAVLWASINPATRL